MCGIAGYVRTGPPERTAETVERMLASLAHRGPDDAGITLIRRADADAIDLSCAGTAAAIAALPRAGGSVFEHDLALGHRRFSIVDLTPGAHQPFWSAERDVCIVLNGEIYNYVELRQELEAGGARFRTRSDTEVLVEAYRRWGVGCFERCAGFWAVVLYDARRRAVLLARDRIGKAPLYVAQRAGALWFASEIKSLFAGAGRTGFAAREQAVADFIALGCRDIDHETFYEGITSFPSAAYAWLEPDGTYAAHPYWQVPTTRLAERDITPGAAAAGLRERLAEALRIRLRADVPVALGLSGGMDSSALAALAASAGLRITAYTIAFPRSSADELPYARAVQRHYPSLIEQRVVEQPLTDFFDAADAYVAHMDEPFHSPNMLTNQRVFRRMADDGSRACVDGGGGDEVLAGYPGVTYMPFLEELLRRGDLRRLHRECVAFSEAPVQPFGPAYWRRLGALLRYATRRRLPARVVWAWHARRDAQLAAAGVRLGRQPRAMPNSDLARILIEKMTHWQMNYWMRSGNLSSMGVPLEVRNPFLDHRVVEYAYRLPLTYLVRDGWLKWILRVATADLLPAEVVWRPNKMGLPLPLPEWLAASRACFCSAIEGLDCPYVDARRLAAEYDRLRQHDATQLWRIMSVCLWWKRCVLGEPLDAGQAAPRGSRSRPWASAQEALRPARC